MTIKETVIKSYTIDDHPNPENVFNWIRENWHDLNAHSVKELEESLRSVADHFGLSLDYSISQVPDRGEFIRLSGVFDMKGVETLHNNNQHLNGMWSDWLITGSALDVGSWDIEFAVLKALHEETDYAYSDENLTEHCEANTYYFLESGELETTHD